jgi:hypothetical protein
VGRDENTWRMRAMSPRACAAQRRHVLSTIMWGPIFNCKWPGKVFQDLFTPRSVPDPDFKPLDLRALRAEHPSDSSLSTNSPEMLTTKRENPVSNG